MPLYSEICGIEICFLSDELMSKIGRGDKYSIAHPRPHNKKPSQSATGRVFCCLRKAYQASIHHYAVNEHFVGLLHLYEYGAFGVFAEVKLLVIGAVKSVHFLAEQLAAAEVVKRDDGGQLLRAEFHRHLAMCRVGVSLEIFNNQFPISFSVQIIL